MQSTLFRLFWFWCNKDCWASQPASQVSSSSTILLSGELLHADAACSGRKERKREVEERKKKWGRSHAWSQSVSQPFHTHTSWVPSYVVAYRDHRWVFPSFLGWNKRRLSSFQNLLLVSPFTFIKKAPFKSKSRKSQQVLTTTTTTNCIIRFGRQLTIQLATLIVAVFTTTNKLSFWATPVATVEYSFIDLDQEIPNKSWRLQRRRPVFLLLSFFFLHYSWTDFALPLLRQSSSSSFSFYLSGRTTRDDENLLFRWAKRARKKSRSSCTHARTQHIFWIQACLLTRFKSLIMKTIYWFLEHIVKSLYQSFRRSNQNHQLCTLYTGREREREWAVGIATVTRNHICFFIPSE